MAILRLRDVTKATGLSRSSVYLRVSQGTFPHPVKLGGARAVGWPESDVDQVLEAYIAGRSEEDLQQLVAQIEAARRACAARGRA